MKDNKRVLVFVRMFESLNNTQTPTRCVKSAMRIKIQRFAVVILLVIGSAGMLLAQNPSYSKTEISQCVQQIADEDTHSVGTLAEALTRGLPNDEAKAYAIYSWVAHNLTYDLAGVEVLATYTSMNEVTKEALAKRKGVCSHYAQLFDALASEAGIPSLVVSGYVKSEKEIHKIPHAWNALMLDGDWYLFDPTWGSGYLNLNTNRYHQEYSEKYFKVSPPVMIKTHMPFDPLMQMLNYPITPADFALGTKPAEPNYLDYKTEIELYRALSEEQQLPEILARIEQQGIANQMIRNQYVNLQRQYDVYLANQLVLTHNRAIYKLKDVIDDYNKYVAFSNSHRGGSPSELNRMQAWLQRIEQNALAVDAIFDTLTITPDLKQTFYANRKSLKELISTVAYEQERLKKKNR